jgi:hypothetical protein
LTRIRSHHGGATGKRLDDRHAKPLKKRGKDEQPGLSQTRWEVLGGQEAGQGDCLTHFLLLDLIKEILRKPSFLARYHQPLGHTRLAFEQGESLNETGNVLSGVKRAHVEDVFAVDTVSQRRSRSPGSGSG